jgi:hypothetical protein
VVTEANVFGPSSTQSAAVRTDSATVEVAGFDDVYQEHFDFVWRSLLRMGVPEFLADDAVQEATVACAVRSGSEPLQRRNRIETAPATRGAHEQLSQLWESRVTPIDDKCASSLRRPSQSTSLRSSARLTPNFRMSVFTSGERGCVGNPLHLSGRAVAFTARTSARSRTRAKAMNRKPTPGMSGLPIQSPIKVAIIMTGVANW